MLVDLGNDRAWEEASLQALLAGPADGLLLFEADLPPGATEHAIQIEMCPARLPVVRLDVEAGVDLALDHLFELGHTQIGHLASSFDAPTFDLRRDRMRERLGHAPPSVARAVHVRGRGRGGRPAARPGRLHRDLLRRRHPRRRRLPRRARTRDRASPRDLSVVGFDDLDFARVLAPPLTTVAIDAEGLGAAAFEALARDLAGETVEREQVMPVRLEVRESTAPA